MKISELKERISKTANNPSFPALYLWGGPGIGKSSAVAQAAEELNTGAAVVKTAHLKDIRALLLDPSDLRGIPFITDHTAFWAPPSFLPREGTGIVLFDELNLAPPLVQGACYQIILDRCCGEYILPPGWRVMAAGNPLGLSGIGFRLPPPLRNRFIHITVDVDKEEWAEWAMQKQLHSSVVAFNLWKEGTALYKFEPSVQENAFPTPRSWAFVSEILTAIGPDDEFIAGAIGQGMAVEFMAFLSVYQKVPSVDDILAGKNPMPTGIDVLWALVSSLIERARKDMGSKTWNRLLEYSMKLADNKSIPGAELSVYLVKTLRGFDKEKLYHLPLIDKWGDRFEGVLK